MISSRIRTVMHAALGGALLCILQSTALGDDWPQWRGPTRTGISQETGWTAKWPEGGPKKLWEASELGVGLSSFSVSKGRVYTMGNVNETDYVWCFDAEKGDLIWKHEYPCSSKDPNGYPGPRCTPTVDDGLAYSVGRQGQLFCLDAAKGTVVWSKDYQKDFGGKPPTWGYAGSPLVEKNWLLVEPGAKGASVVALNKKTGELIWKNGDDPAGYSSIFPFDAEGERCITVFSEANFVARRMKDGSELWRIPWKTSYGVNAATPIIEGNRMFLSSGYGFGCALLEFNQSSAKEIWRNKNMRNHVNSCVLLDGYLYGFDESELRCLDFKTGAVKWKTNAYGKGSVISADKKLILYGQQGKLGVGEVNPESFQEISSAPVLTGKDTWANAVLANGRIYCRSAGKMVCLDVKGN